MRRLLTATLLAAVVPCPSLAAQRADSLPLKPTRSVDFTTSEGTWISLDVSPDGRTIVFELLGDLYALPVSGGAAKRITSGPAFDSQPRYSPDGKRIVFLSDRSGSENIWMCDADGVNPRALTKGDRNLYASPAWTPDGQYVVASKTSMPIGSTYEIWLYHTDGGAGMSLTKDDKGPAPGPLGRGNQNNALGAAFGPDGRYMWYARHRGGFGYNLPLPEWEIAIYDRQTGKVFNQTDLYGSAMRPVLSPDGTWLVYATRYDAETGFRLRNLASGDERWLVYPVQRDDQESRFTRDLMPGSSFTPDSKALIVSYGGKIWRVEVPSGQVSAIPFSAHVQLELGPLVRFETRVDTGPILVKQIRDASPSPDGKRLAFSALDKVYVMDLPSGTPRRLTGDSVHEQVPAWSPDGQWIAYVTWTDQGGYVERTRADGRGRPQRLTPEPAFYDHPAWSPDGQRIVVIKGPRAPRIAEHVGPGYELDWLPVAGGRTTRITPISGGGRPHFSRDPSRIYLYEANEGLVSMRYDGTDRRVHIKVTGFTLNLPDAQPFPADEILIAPDSGRVLATASNYVYLVTLPLVGATPPAINVSDTSAAPFPVHRLTRVGGDFIGWASDGRTVHWSIGRSFFRYAPALGDSLAKLKARADSIRADSLKQATKEKPDSVAKARVDSLAKLPAYEAERMGVTIRVRRDVPRGWGVLRGGRVMTMKGDGMLGQGDVGVTDSRIECVVATCPAPGGARVIDVTGKSVIPGLIDIHAHPWPTWGIHETAVWKYLANLAWGVTTTRDPQTATTDVLTYADQVEAGELIGPRIFHTGPGVFGAFLEENWTSLDDVRNTLKRYSEFYHTNTIKQYMAGNRKQRQWVIMAA